jgi:dipeptidyl aminopeptidase/acylaminoacyl peptidase
MKLNTALGVIFSLILLTTVYSCKEINEEKIESASRPADQLVDTAGQDLSKNEIGVTAVDTPDEMTQVQRQPMGTEFNNLLNEIQIAYIKENNIWIWSKEMGNKQLTYSGDVHQVRIDPGGQLAAYLKQVDDYHAEIWIIEMDGRNERRILGVFELDELGAGARDPNSVAINPYQFDWIPGTRKIAFNTKQIFQDSGFIRLDDLNWVDIDSLERRIIIPPFQGGNYQYSPDGKLIAVSTPDELILISSDGTNRKSLLAFNQVKSYSEEKYYPDPIWSPDSKVIYAAISPVDPLAMPRKPTALWEIPSSGGSAVQTGSIMTQPFINSDVVYSPDAKRIIFLRETGKPKENMLELFIANSDGSEEQLIQKDQFIQILGWSPDSINFVFKHGENWEVKIVPVGNTPVRLISDPFGIYIVKWVNEESFLILKEQGENYLLVLNSLNGESVVVDEIPAPPPDFDFVF